MGEFWGIFVDQSEIISDEKIGEKKYWRAALKV